MTATDKYIPSKRIKSSYRRYLADMDNRNVAPAPLKRYAATIAAMTGPDAGRLTEAAGDWRANKRKAS